MKQAHIREIVPEQPGMIPYLKRVYDHRSLILTLARRDIKVEYAQTAFGLLWAILKPLTGLLIFTLFFDGMLNLHPGLLNNIPYPLFAFSGMTAWYYFSFVLSSGGASLVSSQHLMSKVYFPKLVLPLSKVLVGLVDFGLSLVLLFILMLLLGHPFTANLLFLPVAVLINMIMGLSVGIWLSALTIRFRDFQHFIPYIIQFAVWLTPVFYPFTLIPKGFEFTSYFNPMAGMIAFFRWTLLGDIFPSVYYLPSFFFMCVLLVGGVFYFRKVESTVVDLV
jgi:lipopolysaccharide transport system permease protein